jgi:serine/threonine-protein kinase
MMHASRATRGALVGLLVFAFVSGAREGISLADEPPAPRADNRARAQQLFESALADAEAGNLAAACPKFQASQDADPKTSTLLNLASCYEKNGQTASAWGAFREAEGLARKAGRRDWETTAHARAEALELKLVRLTVQVPEASRVPGLTITRDGARLAAGEWGVAIPVDPGAHAIVASAEGRKTWETRATAREASVTVAVPVLEALPVSVVAPEPRARAGAEGDGAPARSRSWWTPMRTAGVVVAGAGVVGLAAGGVLGLLAQGSYSDARARCTAAPRGCPSSAVSDSNAAYGLATGASVVFVVGAVAAVAGGALIVFAPAASSSSAAAAARPSGTRVSAALEVGPGSVGVSGRW